MFFLRESRLKSIVLEFNHVTDSVIFNNIFKFFSINKLKSVQFDKNIDKPDATLVMNKYWKTFKDAVNDNK